MSEFVFLFRATEAGQRDGDGHARARATEHADLAALDPRAEANGHLKDRGSRSR